MKKSPSKYRCRKVVKRDPRGNIHKIYESVSDAALCCVELKFTVKQLYNHLCHAYGTLWHGYYWEWLDGGQEGVVEKLCLGADCGRKFLSRGIHHRICPTCVKRNNYSPSAHKVHTDSKR